ncbi:MAG: hypothetical protein LJE87_00915 [Deltaproteobacteria bacterium]|nr:hypothetical protein [Deltaproteobacteria bacterium]
MKRLVLSILLILSGYFLSLGTARCFGLDEGGCLTCHQYPGLVSLEKNNEFKPVHIDENKFFSSPHGKIRCEKCHTAVVKVPHTGETATDCTTECHQKDAKKIATYPLKTLHQGEHSYIVRLEDESSCRVCHPIYPHSKNKLVRAFLNMHTGFMFCEVCHINRAKVDHLVYDWEDSENADFRGKPFGTYFNPHTNKAHKADEHFISRIAVFSLEGGTKQRLVNTQDTSAAKEFMLASNSLSAKVKKQKLSHFHRNVERKEISVACNECHSTESILDFKKLGFDEFKTKHLIYINIKGLVTKYKVFYFPKLFDN